MNDSVEGQVVDADGNPVRWMVDDGSCPECGADEKKQKTGLGSWVTCMGCGHQRRRDDG